MNHPSEWARFFDENTGSYRYKHKGSGVIRDTFMTIGKVFKDNVKNAAKKTAEKATKTIAEKAGQKVGELAVEKGSKQIRKILQERKQKRLSQGAKKKLANILQNQNRNRFWQTKFDEKIFFYLYKLLSTCSELNRTSKNLNIFKLI